MVLSDYEIRAHSKLGSLTIDPYSDDQVNPASYDVRLGSVLRTFREREVYDIANLGTHTDEVVIPEQGYVLDPGQFVLGSTRERISTPLDLSCMVNGKSSLGRLGLMIHVTAGYIDPGFDGEITLEIANLLGYPIKLYAGMRVAQLVFAKMTSPPMIDYSMTGRYQGQTGPTESKYKLD